MDQSLENPRFLGFDVFGTVVDWRTSVADALRALFASHGRRDLDAFSIADEWRGLYQPSMELIRSGRREWVPLTILNQENLRTVLGRHSFDLSRLADHDLVDLNRVWERLRPWGDAVTGLQRLKGKFGLATFSNGSIENMVNLARFAGLPWDVILGAELSRTYKPQPETYLRSVAALGLVPSQVMMVAAHNDDLFAARQCGLRTAFIHRSNEHGPDQNTDLMAEADWDFEATDLDDLASQLTC